MHVCGSVHLGEQQKCMWHCICIKCFPVGVGIPQGESSVHEGARRGTVWEGASDESKGENNDTHTNTHTHTHTHTHTL